MRQAVGELRIQAEGQGLFDITGQISSWVDGQAFATGLLTIFCKHTSASLLVQESASADARRDLERYFARVAPEDPHLYAHDDEGPDDMPAHLRTALTQVQLAIPLTDGRLALGRWQAIYLFEHRLRPQPRTLALHLLGD
jgi:secondary thiamine-phosphate synthase enzyme